MEKRRDEEL
jgi:hypothetical protein